MLRRLLRRLLHLRPFPRARPGALPPAPEARPVARPRPPVKRTRYQGAKESRGRNGHTPARRRGWREERPR